MTNLFDLIPPLEKDHPWKPEPPPQLDGVKEVFLNVETNGFRWWAGDRPVGISVRRPDGRSWYLPFRHDGGGNLDEEVVKRWAQNELKNCRITNANTRFDVHHLREWGVDLEAQGCQVSDIQHYAALLDDNRFKFNLDLLATEFLGPLQIPRLNEKYMKDYHAGEVAPRAIYNVELVHKLRDHFWPMLEEQGLQRVRQLEDEIIFVVCEMEKNGAIIDLELMEKWQKEVQVKRQALIQQIWKETGLQINPGSDKDLERLFKHRGIQIKNFTPTGRPSFAYLVLKAIDDPIIRLVVQAENLKDLASRYTDKYPKVISSDGILRYALHQLRTQKDDSDSAMDAGTVSGRFSSSAIADGEGVNIQQVMKVAKQISKYGPDFIVRELHVPESGLFLSADAQQIEYRIFAHEANNPQIIQAYKNDPSTSFHKFVWEMFKKYKSDLSYRRQKDLNFAKIYGAGIKKLALMLEFITTDEFKDLTAQQARRDHPRLSQAAEIEDIYNRLLPEVSPLLSKAGDLAKNRGFIKTILGRRARFPDGQKTHKALNRRIQGSAADIMKKKLIELHANRKETQFKMRFTVHDECDGDIPDLQHAEKVKEILNHQSFPSLRIPILWDLKTGINWKEAGRNSDGTFD